MGNGIGAVVAAGVVGTIAWAIQRVTEQDKAAAAMPASFNVVQKGTSTSDRLKGVLAGVLGDALENVNIGGGGGAGFFPQRETAGYKPKSPQPVQTGASGGLKGLLNLIGGVEAPKGYNQVYGGIRSADQPPKPLTTMTVNEVLAWQDSIDSRYPSEAAGRYQVMEDTLRPLVRAGKVNGNARFDEATQDQIAVMLMERRGLNDYLSGKMSETKFAQKLSQEWASLPAATVDRSGRKATGQSYYAGDGLNKSHLTLGSVFDAMRGL